MDTSDLGWLIFAYYLFSQWVLYSTKYITVKYSRFHKWSDKHSPEEVFGIQGKAKTPYSKAALYDKHVIRIFFRSLVATYGERNFRRENRIIMCICNIIICISYVATLVTLLGLASAQESTVGYWLETWASNKYLCKRVSIDCAYWIYITLQEPGSHFDLPAKPPKWYRSDLFVPALRPMRGCARVTKPNSLEDRGPVL
jgi:hypothetical protein